MVALNLKKQFKYQLMQPERSSSRAFIYQEQIVINKEIQKIGQPIGPKEINTIISNLQQRYGVNILPHELQPFISKYQSNQKIKIEQIVTQERQTESAFFKQFAQVPKIQEVRKQKNQQRKVYVNRSKRKIKPTEPTMSKNLQELVQYLDNNTNDCHMILQPKNKKNTTQKDSIGILHQNCQFVFNQQFYSILDRPYLKDENLFKKILQEMRMNPEGMTYEDYRLLKLALPQPKLFNSQFINLEIQKLNDYRNQVRSAPKNVISSISKRSKGEQLSVGREVIAVHPVCGHLHSGSILAIYKQNQYMVKFVKPELGTQKVLDINITLKELNHPHKIIIENVNYEAMALTIKLLEYKADLIRMLAKYNDIAHQAQKTSNNLENKFFQQYGWIGSTINILSLGIKHILSKFRIRGLDATNQEKIGKNFASVLLNPLNLMEKQLDKSSQNSDLNASKQIKRIIYNYKQSKVDQYTKDLFNKHWNEIDINPDQKQQFELLIRSLVGILVSLKIEHKNFSIEQNKYLKELMSHFDNRFPEHFNEIYQLLTSITSKLNQDQK